MDLSSPTASEPSALDLPDAVARARDHLLALQDPAGWWKAELETNVTMDAEDQFLRQFLGIRDPATTERAARWIRSQQRDDGTWAIFTGGPGDLSTTIEAYAALRLAGDAPEDDHMRRAAAFVRAEGGIEAARAFTHIWLALFGEWDWDDVPALPPEVVLLPSWVPLNIYDFACWARQTIVALAIVLAVRPVRPLGVTLDELRSGRRPTPERLPLTSPRGALARLDRAARAYGRHPIRPLRELALARAEAWILRRQEADGSWGGIQPPWVYSIMALHLRGYPLDHPVLRAALDGLEGFMIEEDGTRRMEACQSPVWDTVLAMIALADAGVEPDHPALVRAADWVLDEEIRVPGDWTVRRPGLTPGGWAFEFANDVYPDIDDTAEVVLALRRVRHPDPARLEAAVRRGVDWVVGMQSRNGGWGAFDADNTQALCRELPFCDFGAVIDDPSADVTAHVVEMLAGEGRGADPAAREGLRYLLDEQEPGGSWFGRWGVNHVYGTGAALPAAVAAGVPRDDRRVRAAVDWLERCQNADGGWGEDVRSYTDAAWVGRGASTASQTAWALLALHAAGERTAAVAAGLNYLVETQRADGSWDEALHTGTGFPGDFSINYHLYRLVFPLQALGRWLAAEAA